MEDILAKNLLLDNLCSSCVYKTRVCFSSRKFMHCAFKEVEPNEKTCKYFVKDARYSIIYQGV